MRQSVSCRARPLWHTSSSVARPGPRTEPPSSGSGCCCPREQAVVPCRHPEPDSASRISVLMQGKRSKGLKHKQSKFEREKLQLQNDLIDYFYWIICDLIRPSPRNKNYTYLIYISKYFSYLKIRDKHRNFHQFHHKVRVCDVRQSLENPCCSGSPRLRHVTVPCRSVNAAKS